MSERKICVLGLGKSGVPLGAVIACKCPEIRVTVVKPSAEDTSQWYMGCNLPSSLSGLEDFVRKCQNKNLVFSSNEVLAVQESEIIFIVSESRLKSFGDSEIQMVDLSGIEKLAHLIAKHAESNKIIVENSTIPLKSAEVMSNVFKHNGRPDVKLEVLSNPDFYERESSLRNMLFPDCVLIGSENTPSGLAAAKKLSSVYERWVPAQNIITRTNWSVELSNIATSAMASQAKASIYSIASICEESGKDVTSVIELLSKNEGTGTGCLDLSPYTGRQSLILQSLVYMCEFIGLREAADYWRQVLEMFNFEQDRFLKKLIFLKGWNRKMVLLGYGCDTQTTAGSPIVEVCKFFLEENAVITISNTRVTEDQVIGDLKSAGCDVPEEQLKKLLVFVEDPSVAAKNSQLIVVCGGSPKLAGLKFKEMYEGMVKPAYMLHWGQGLPHDQLSEMGFKVYALGKGSEK